MSKLKVSLGNVLKYCTVRKPTAKGYYYIFSLFNVIRPQKPATTGNNDDEKLSKYWLHQTIPEIIAQADQLYNDEKFMEVYDMLNRLRFTKEVEILWRIARALYRLCSTTNVTSEVRWEMTEEAFKLLELALLIGQTTTGNVRTATVTFLSKNSFQILSA